MIILIRQKEFMVRKANEAKQPFFLFEWEKFSQEESACRFREIWLSVL